MSKPSGSIKQVHLPTDATGVNHDIIPDAVGNGSYKAVCPTLSADDIIMMQTNPTGTGSFSLNRKANTTIGTKSSTEGDNNTASGEYSHAEGYNNTASAYCSHAEGYYTTASGSRSHAEGIYTVAQRKSQHAFGEYNVLDTGGTGIGTRGNYVEIVGNGTADNARSNARTLDWNGNETIAGNLRASGLTDGTTTKTMTDVLAGNSTTVKVDGTSITSSGVADLKTMNSNYNASSNKLATASDIPTITSTDVTIDEQDSLGFVVTITFSESEIPDKQAVYVYDGSDTSGTLVFSDTNSGTATSPATVACSTGHLYIRCVGTAQWINDTIRDVTGSITSAYAGPGEGGPLLITVNSNGSFTMSVDYDF